MVDVHSGILHKCGGRIKTWTKRWMVLRSDYCLYYYKDIAKGHLGVVSLRDPNFKVRTGEKSDISWPKNIPIQNTMAVVTSPRTYFMYAETSMEAEDWREALNKMHQNLLEDTARKSFSVPRPLTSVQDRETILGTQSLDTRTRDHAQFISDRTHLNRPERESMITDTLTSSKSSMFGTQYPLSPISLDGENMFFEESGHLGHLDGMGEREEEEEEGVETERGREGQDGGGGRDKGGRGIGEGGEAAAGGGGGGGGGGGEAAAGGGGGGGGEEEDVYHLYSVPPPSNGISPTPVGEREREMVGEAGSKSEDAVEEETLYEDYVIPPDATSLQNFSVSLGGPGVVVTPPPITQPTPPVERPESSCSLQAFYDLAQEVRDSEREVLWEEGENYDVIRPVSLGGGKYGDVAEISSSSPTTSNQGGDKSHQISQGRSESSQTHKRSALNQPLPPVPGMNFAENGVGTDAPLGKRSSIIYEDVSDSPATGKRGIERGEDAIYELVLTSDHNYCPVAFEEDTDPLHLVHTSRDATHHAHTPSGREVEGQRRERRGLPPPLPLKEEEEEERRNIPPPLPPKEDDDEESDRAPSQRPIPTSRAISPASQLPGNRDLSESPQKRSHDPAVRSHDLGRRRPSNPQSSPTGSPLLPGRFTFPASPDLSAADKSHTPLPTPRKSIPSSPPSAPSPLQNEPSSPILIPRQKFGRPPSPRSRGQNRPPSPLLAGRRASSSSGSSHSSYSPKGGGGGGGGGGGAAAAEGEYDGVEIHVGQRSRNGSLSEEHLRAVSPLQKEKGMALFSRRRDQVAMVAEDEDRRRVKSMIMLQGVQGDKTLSSEEKTLFAETLREVEAERYKASEERYRWERERLQLEDDRKRFEQERKVLMEELEQTRQQILQA